MSESGVLDLYLYLGPTPKDVIRQNAKLTGVYSLPPVILNLNVKYFII